MANKQKKIGRPLLHLTQDEQDDLCEWVSQARGLKNWCDDNKHSWLSVNNFIADNKDFRDKFARAREAHADYLADEKRDILAQLESDKGFDDNGNRRIDPGLVALARLKTDQCDKTAAQLAPKRYGTKIEHTGEGGGAIMFTLTKEDADI